MEDGLCVNHTSDPDVRERVREGRSRGGKNARHRADLGEIPPPPASYSDAVAWYAWLAQVTALGAVSSSRANALRSVIDKLVETLEPAQEEQEMAARLEMAEQLYLERFGRKAQDRYKPVWDLFLEWREREYPESSPYWRTPAAPDQWSRFLEELPEKDPTESEQQFVDRARRALDLRD